MNRLTSEISELMGADPILILHRGEELAVLKHPIQAGSKAALISLQQGANTPQGLLTTKVAKMVHGHIEAGNFGLAHQALAAYFDGLAGAQEPAPVAANVFTMAPGEFMMGGIEEDPHYDEDEILHKVRITYSVEIQTEFVSPEEFRELMGREPRHDWNDAIEYAQAYSKKTGKNYRLITEAEWERARRHNKIEGDFPEWTGDIYGPYGKSAISIDPEGAEKGPFRVIRGLWDQPSGIRRVARRGYEDPNKCDSYVRFRLVREI